jgi:hypothetical protein
MRMPRVRFTVRGLMLLVVFVALGAALALQGVFGAAFEHIVWLWPLIPEATADRPGIGFGLIATGLIGIAALTARRRVLRLRVAGEAIDSSSVARSLLISAFVAATILLAAGCVFCAWAYLFAAFYLGVGSHSAWPDVAFDWHQRETVTTGLVIAIAATWSLRRRLERVLDDPPCLLPQSRLLARRFVVAAAVAAVLLSAEVMRRRRATFLRRAALAGQLARELALDVPTDRLTIESYRQLEAKYARAARYPWLPLAPDPE